MITLIGTSTSCIGFGLCGITDIHEVTRRTSNEDILEIIQSANEIILIDHDIHEKIKLQLATEKTIIVIPDRYAMQTNEDTFLEELMRDTIGA